MGSVDPVVRGLCFGFRFTGLWNTLVAWSVRARVVGVLYTVHVFRFICLMVVRIGLVRTV